MCEDEGNDVPPCLNEEWTSAIGACGAIRTTSQR